MQIQTWPACCGAMIASDFYTSNSYELDANGQCIKEFIPKGEIGYYGEGAYRYKLKPALTSEEAKKQAIAQLEKSKVSGRAHLTVAIISDQQADQLKLARKVGFVEVATWKTSHQEKYWLHLFVWGAEKFPVGEVQIGAKPRRKLPSLKQRLVARVRKTAL